MKRIINKFGLFLLPAVLLWGCGNKEEKKATLKPEQIIAQAKEVVAIGKIVPEGGVVSIALEEAAVVERILVKVGDSVMKDAVLVQLPSQTQELGLAEARAQFETRRAEDAADVYELKSAQAQLSELQKRYQTSKELVDRTAETREVLLADRSAFIQQQQKVAQAKQRLAANRRSLDELRVSVRKAQQELADRKIKAPASGLILSMDVDPGETIESNRTFAEIAPAGRLMVECEVDELYATKVTKGQQVQIFAISGTTPLAEGNISYVGASLQDKSILYEKVGEGSDRRVRRVKVNITSQHRELLINDKVECRILIR